MRRAILFALPFVAAGCTTAQSIPEPRPMDEIPAQRTLENGEREYRFASGCVVVLEATRAVLVREDASCALHHRDIALLYASAD